jgi:ribonuclease BN (tRNA processing enzyme)
VFKRPSARAKRLTFAIWQFAWIHRERQLWMTMALVTEEIATHHGDCPSVAYRISNKGVVAVFSGDMDASALPNLVQLAKNADLLIFNCAVPDPPELPSQLYDLHIPTGRLG